MPSFSDGALLSGRFTDFDTLAEATARWRVRFSQIGTGAFAGRVDVATTRDLQIAQHCWSTGMMVEGEHPPGAVSLGLLASAPAGAHWNHAAVPPRATLFGGRPGHRVNLLSLGPVEVVAVSIDLGVFEQEFAARLGPQAGPPGRDFCLHAEGGAPGMADRAQAVGALRAVLANGRAPTRAARLRLQQAVLQVLFEGLEAPAGPVPLSTRRRIARQAEEVLRARLDDPPSLGELCRTVGAGERSLHLAFEEAFGQPPKRYLRALRLNAVRRQLSRGQESVTTVAADFGFFHLARFAAEYRQHFGELPSATLRRARG